MCVRLSTRNLSIYYPPRDVYLCGARNRRPVRIAIERNACIGSFVTPRHFSDKNSTHTVVGTECTTCLTARCAAPKRVALCPMAPRLTRLIRAQASPGLTLEQLRWPSSALTSIVEPEEKFEGSMRDRVWGSIACVASQLVCSACNPIIVSLIYLTQKCA